MISSETRESENAFPVRATKGVRTLLIFDRRLEHGGSVAFQVRLHPLQRRHARIELAEQLFIAASRTFWTVGDGLADKKTPENNGRQRNQRADKPRRENASKLAFSDPVLRYPLWSRLIAPYYANPSGMEAPPDRFNPLRSSLGCCRHSPPPLKTRGAPPAASQNALSANTLTVCERICYSFQYLDPFSGGGSWNASNFSAFCGNGRFSLSA